MLRSESSRIRSSVVVIPALLSLQARATCVLEGELAGCESAALLSDHARIRDGTAPIVSANGST